MSSVMEMKKNGILLSGKEISSKSVQMYVCECEDGIIVEGYVNDQFIQAVGENEQEAMGKFFMEAARTVGVSVDETVVA